MPDPERGSKLEAKRQELAACRQRVRELEEEIAALERAPSSEPPPPNKRRSSIHVPEWLVGAPSDARPRTATLESSDVPGWLRSASIEVLGQDLDSAAMSSGSKRQEDGAPTISFEKVAEGMPLKVTLGTHVLRAHPSSGNHRAHEIHVTLGSQSWAVHRRFSEFRKLHEQLQQLRGLDMGLDKQAAQPFPVPKLLFHSDAALAQRQKRLQAFLDGTIAHARGTPQAISVLEGFLVGPASTASDDHAALSVARRVGTLEVYSERA